MYIDGRHFGYYEVQVIVNGIAVYERFVASDDLAAQSRAKAMFSNGRIMYVTQLADDANPAWQ